MTADDGIRFAWLDRKSFPRPCDFCGEPIHAEHAYRMEDTGRRQVGEMPGPLGIHPVFSLGPWYRCERCLCKLDPPPLKIEWGLSVNTWAPEGEKDAWDAIGTDAATLEACYGRAQKQFGQFNIVKWYKRAVGQSGTPCFTGWAENLPPIEELQAKADGTWKPPAIESKPCVTCGDDCLIRCRKCGAATCWNHRKDAWTPHTC